MLYTPHLSSSLQETPPSCTRAIRAHWQKTSAARGFALTEKVFSFYRPHKHVSRTSEQRVRKYYNKAPQTPCPALVFFIWNTGTPHLSPNTPGNRKTNPITALHTLYNRLLYCRIRYSVILHYPSDTWAVRILQNHSKIKQSKYFDRRKPPASNHKYANRRTAFLFCPYNCAALFKKIWSCKNTPLPYARPLREMST